MSRSNLSAKIEAVIFDLYDTLVRIGNPVIRRRIPALLEVGARSWMELVRAELLTTPFTNPKEFVRFICERLRPSRSAAVEERCLAAVEEEIASVELLDGAVSVLAFLKRRGYKLGLLSNLTSVHKEPVERFGLNALFSAVGFSCDEGTCKPRPGIYLDLCRRLGVRPQSVLMVGNSLQNDVRAAEALGMSALHVSRLGGHRGVASVGELGWLFLGEDGPARSVIPRDQELPLGDAQVVIREVTPLSDTEQGRYNLVASTRTHCREMGAATTNGEVYCKRFLFPEAAYVEEFAYRLMVEVGLPSCRAVVSPDPEPCLIVSKAPGRKFEGSVDPALAFELGRHSAIAYIFANADLRPRNAFVSYEGSRPVVTMLDLEHCFFNLALDLTGLDNPLDPRTIDRLSEDELLLRVRRRVLTERATRRAMRTFFELESMDSPEGCRFKAGWVAVYERVQRDWERIAKLIEQRLYSEPFLIIGTRAYRRAVARLDVLDMKKRVDQDAETLLPKLVAFKQSDGRESRRDGWSDGSI